MTLVLMKINNVFACHTAMVYMYIELRVYANLNGCARVLLCQHFASESHRKATTKREKRKERNVVLFRLVSFPTRSRPVTSRWGFQLGYHRENNISRVPKKRIDCACTKDVKIVQNMNSILSIAKIQFSFLLINALN